LSEPKWCSFLCQTIGKESSSKSAVGGKGNNCYYFSVDGVKVWLEPTMVIHPNRFAVEAEYEMGTSSSNKMVSFTLSEGNGNHLTVTLPDARTFMNWHTAVRVALADLIFSHALCPTKTTQTQGFGQGQGICVSTLEQAIMLCGPLVPEDHPTMMRAKTLWISKLELQDVVDRLKDCPQKVRKEEVRVLVQQLADENADPLLVSDPDAIFVLKIGAKVLTKSELMAFCKPASPAFKAMSAFEHDYNDENVVNGSRRGNLSKQKSGKGLSNQKSVSSKLSPALTPNATSTLMTITNPNPNSTTPRVPLKNLLSTFKTPSLSPISSLSLMSTKNNKSSNAIEKNENSGGLIASPAEIKVNPDFKKKSKNIPEGYVTNAENLRESNDENDILPKASIASRSSSSDYEEGVTSLPVAEVMNEKQASVDLEDELARTHSTSSSSSSTSNINAPSAQVVQSNNYVTAPISGVPLWLLVSIIVATILVTVIGSVLMVFGIQSLTKSSSPTLQHPYYAAYNEHIHSPHSFNQQYNQPAFVSYDQILYEQQGLQQGLHNPNQQLHSINRSIKNNQFTSKTNPSTFMNSDNVYMAHPYSQFSQTNQSLKPFNELLYKIHNAIKNFFDFIFNWKK